MVNTNDLAIENCLLTVSNFYHQDYNIYFFKFCLSIQKFDLLVQLLFYVCFCMFIPFLMCSLSSTKTREIIICLLTLCFHGSVFHMSNGTDKLDCIYAGTSL